MVKITRVTGKPDIQKWFPACCNFKNQFDPTLLEESKSFADAFDDPSIGDSTDQILEAFPITQRISKWTTSVRAHQYVRWEEMSFIMSFIFGRVQFPIAHEKGDSLPYEIFIKGPSGSGKTSLICPLEIFFEAPGMKECLFLR